MTDHLIQSPARPRERVHVQRTMPNIGFGKMLFGFLLAVIVPIVFEEDTERPLYEGHFGSDPNRKPYDRMTKAEHEEAGDWWNTDAGLYR